jgi:AmmeMemoRadiSam system protein A
MNHSIYVQIAKDAINAHFQGLSIDKNDYLLSDSMLREKKASFVTLTIHGHLRGCIGSIIATRPLIDDLISNALSAAFHDPRFSPLSVSEWQSTAVEVSLLSDPEPVIYHDTAELRKIIRPKIDGVILRLQQYQATFLPQVWDDIHDFDAFFSHLGMKAGIGSEPLSYHPDIYTYQVEKFSEGDDNE